MKTRISYIEEMCKRLPWMSKSQVDEFLKTQAAAITDALNADSGGVPTVVIPGVVKITSKYKAPQPERMRRNPITGAPLLVGAKPASRKLKAKFTTGICAATGGLVTSVRGPGAKVREKRDA
jgi:nucleoid DNA-binding protein